MKIALTGTPGTGKSTISRILKKRGFRVHRLDEVARERAWILGVDEERDSLIVDLERLGEYVRVNEGIFVAHYSHLLPVDLVIVLRTHPEVLRRRLEARGFDEAKIRENVEAEAMSLITSEAIELHGRERVQEVDTTNLNPATAADEVVAIIKGRRPGAWVDWTEVILGWY